MLIKICELFNVSAEYMLGIVKQRTPLHKVGFIELKADFPLNCLDEVENFIDYVTYREAKRKLEQ